MSDDRNARRSLLQSNVRRFCADLVVPVPPPKLLSQHFRPDGPKITEHGPSWASARLPFLGKTFTGTEECIEYFDVLSEVLGMKLADDAFPWKGGFIVDGEVGMVSVVGKGRFESKKTGKGWDEQFIYRFSDFDDQGRIGHWEVWADPLSAWEAVGE